MSVETEQRATEKFTGRRIKAARQLSEMNAVRINGGDESWTIVREDRDGYKENSDGNEKDDSDGKGHDDSKRNVDSDR